MFLYPSIFLAMMGINPVKFLYLKSIWVPMIGWVPTEDKFSENSNAPDKLYVSDKPNDFIFFVFWKILYPIHTF